MTESKLNKIYYNVAEFFKEHPIIFNLLLIFISFLVLCNVAMFVLDIFTEHGKYKVVPNVKGMILPEAAALIEVGDFKWEITDSIYNDTFAPGTVLEQTPKENSKVKSNRTIYLVVNAFSPRLVIFPNVCDMSERQAIAKLQEVGLKNIVSETISSPYQGLVIECKINGLPITPGKKIPSSSNITLYVGSGEDLSTDSLSIGDDELMLDDELFEEILSD